VGPYPPVCVLAGSGKTVALVGHRLSRRASREGRPFTCRPQGEIDVARTSPRSSASPSRRLFRIAASVALAIISVVLVFGILGVFVGINRGNDLAATASVTLSTGTSQVFAAPEGAAGIDDLDQHVESQIEVLASLEVARRAASILAEGAYSPTPEEIQDSTAIARLPGGAEIEVTYTAEQAADAIAGANAVVEGYQELMRQRWNDQYATAIASVNAGIQAAEADSRRVVEEARTTPGEQETNISAEIDAIIAELKTIDEAILAGAGDETLQTLDMRTTVLQTELDALETLFAEQLEVSEVSAAAARLDAALVREATLRARLIELEVDSRVDGDGVAFSTPAQAAAATTAGPVLAGIAGLVLGAFVGLGALYWVQRRKSRINSPADAGRVLGYPLLSIVDPRQVGPTEDADRYMTSDLLGEIRSRALWREPQVFGLVGADDASRRSTSMRLAWACADDGINVLLVDGDLESTADRDGLATTRGLADFVANEVSLASIIEERRTPKGKEFHALGHGRKHLVDALRVQDLRRALDLVKNSYDAVIVDISLASLHRFSDDDVSAFSFVVVVEHESEVDPVKRLLRTFEETEVEPVGFLYAYDGVHDAPADSRSGESSSLRS